MAETGGPGPILEGVGRPEAVKKGVVDRVKDRWKAKLAEQAEERAQYKAKKAEWKKLGPAVEDKYIAAFDRITGAMNAGMLKTVAEKARPMVKIGAKLARVESAVVDLTVGTIPLVLGSLVRGRGISALAEDMMGGRKYSAGQVFKAILYGGAGASLGAGLLWASPARRAAGFWADVGGAVGEKAVRMTNKIFGRAPVAPTSGV